ncbi:hypothetical protein ESY86_07295 [Subsaximicrobium wynnwilliamsii]|jgi:hypothetical protein|uniref:Lipocalin-like domain-containing protein n=1 Tax=Subsaximicrobium wynnwilliamsii TaxID=291179 RepID=A0A5C6ZLN0_9FLAO|nr:hypothetical protein [Subsaximicrobium wynnwilliamsii]TXD83843.1 hypothetical protein ESY87_07455 [Subsaximicrobium wynnwilliamsii]TXD89584.1 hypothetical protein ESY86_07295 [Subsaximicrobium wynnwilliamsii]TXE02625.1 hypothetical protein ESY88_11550 [Subsaximicrobium wynnwilliamsii]
MNYRLLILLTLITTAFIGCNDDDPNRIDAVPSISGTWNLSNVSGGFVGTDVDFEDGLITWSFNTETSQVKVINSNADPVAFDGLPSGTYDYVLENNAGVETLKVDYLDMTVNAMSNTQMLLDDGIAYDGFLLSFSR